MNERLALERAVKEAYEKGKQTQEQSSLDEGEELEIPENFEASTTILEHIKEFYRHYKSMKAYQVEIKDIVKLKVSLGYPITKRKGQIEPKKKAREDKPQQGPGLSTWKRWLRYSRPRSK